MEDFAAQLAGVKTAAIAGHIRPDGDCVGSCLATYPSEFSQDPCGSVFGTDPEYF